MTEADSKTHQGQGPGVLFRVDGGRVWGVSLGHVFRCMALAGELQKRYQADATFLMKDYEDGVRVVKSQGFDVHTIEREIGHDQEIAFIEQWGSDLIVFDLIDIAEKNIGRLLDSGKRVVVIDDTGNKRVEAEVVINGSIVPEFHRYLQTGRDTSYYLGPRYCILGEEFDNLPRRELRPKVETILISMGGSDPAGLTSRVARFFGISSFSFVLVFVLGPGFEGREEVEDSLQPYKGQYYVVETPPALAPLFATGDLAILAGGCTAYEAARMGVPSVIIPSIKHEVQVAEAFSHSEVFLTIPLGWQLSQDEFNCALGNVLRKLSEDAPLRQQMSLRARKLIDGHGRERVIQLLLRILDS